jgi:hypothetical protein
MIESTVKIIKIAIILLSVVGLCFSGSFSVMQILPAVQAAPASNKPEDVATLAYI